MGAPVIPSSTAWVALFDLDGTLTWRDTLLGFLKGYVLRRPGKWLKLWQLPFVISRYALTTHDRGSLKGDVIRLVMGGEQRAIVDAWADDFVTRLPRRRVFRPQALAVLEKHRAAGDHLVLLSASPDLYVPRIGRLLGFELTMCTEIRWHHDTPGRVSSHDLLDGALASPNRHGKEKSSCLAVVRTRYPGLPVMAYGNNASDLDHLQLADAGMLVNGNRAARRAAASLGLRVGRWS